jgi:hypothetical protein
MIEQIARAIAKADGARFEDDPARASVGWRWPALK